jgi:protease-4
MNNSSENESEFNQKLVNKLASEFLTEQRRARRWSVFFKLLLALYLFTFLAVYLSNGVDMIGLGDEEHTALIEVTGVIAANADASADNIVSSLRSAFENEKTAGVILRINSPGGSPVQAGYINDEISRLKSEHPDIPVYAVISDLCASGGYYIAAAADKIYADKASLVGSIGVIMSGFGFVDTLQKLGIERRVLTAGENKAFMDSFAPLKNEEVYHVEELLEEMHQQFIDVVKQGRGDRLLDDEVIFSGLIWSGEESVNIGLVDALGSSSYVAREIIGAEDIVDFTFRRNVLDQFASQLGASMVNTFGDIISIKIK